LPALLEFALASGARGAGQTGGLRDPTNTTAPQGLGFAGCPLPTEAFGHQWLEQLKLGPNGSNHSGSLHITLIRA
jgi:hypothetical protein